MVTVHQSSNNLLGLLGFVGHWVNLRKQHRDQAKAKEKQWERENAEREQTEKLLFLKLLQTMCKVCEQLKPLPWVHTFGGWSPGLTVRALPLDKGYTNSHTPIYEINHESPRLHGGASAKYSRNYYHITITQYVPEQPINVYNKIHFVPDDQIPYMQAVFDLTGCRNMSSPERAQNLEQLMGIDIAPQLPYQNDYKITGAIKYLENLLNKSK
ncbi:MAG: hypothetical protein J6Y07_03175 [Alphaproteobacteria bacterium]|nr:hypothetical protein [Alphaproteobacteria bacterium]